MIENIDNDAFFNLDNLKMLALNNNRLTKFSMAYLKYNSQIDSLGLNSNNITEIEDVEFAKNSTLTFLSVSNTFFWP